jgi:Protein of unknown function (DUF2009)
MEVEPPAPATAGGRFAERAAFTPLRLTMEERRRLRLLEAALSVSEYTDKVRPRPPRPAPVGPSATCAPVLCRASQQAFRPRLGALTPMLAASLSLPPIYGLSWHARG